MACECGATLILRMLFEIREGLFGVFGLFAVGVEFQVGLVFGDGFVFFLHLLRNLSKGEVGGRVIGLDADRIFGAEVGALVVFVVQVKLCDVEILVDTLVVGLNSFDLGEFAVNGGAFGGIAFGVWIVVGDAGGVVAAGAGAGAGVIAGEFGSRLRGEWVSRRCIGGSC